MSSSSVSLKRLCYHLYKQVCYAFSTEIVTALLRVSYDVFGSYKWSTRTTTNDQFGPSICETLII